MLITGATGFLGSRLASRALARGTEVRTLTRREWDGPPWVKLSDRFFGELPDGIPADAFRGIEAVVHCAASASTDDRVAMAVNARGAEAIARQAARAGVRTLILVSSSTAAPDSLSAYGRSKAEGERLVRNVPGLQVVILRPNLIVGGGGAGVYGRMAGMVRTLPVIPLLGGGHAVVQPIHVDDLCDAIFRSIERSGELQGAILNLGHPEGLALRDVLGLISVHETGRRKPMLSIPLAPVEWAVRGAEALGVRLPVSTANLQGLRQIVKAETDTAMKRLGLTLRPVGDLACRVFPQPVDAARRRPVRVLLVGGGRIGLLHGINLGRLPGLVLAGIVDPNPKAVGLLRGMGIAPPSWPGLAAAFASAQFDAAIIATPPSTHLPLARECLERGLAVLVEKPLAPDEARSDGFRELDRRFPGKLMGGYVIPRTPHIIRWAERLRSGDLGRVTGFRGISLLSYMLTRGMKTWQANPAMSGGGVLMNPGVHILSMLWAACGAPAAIRRTEQVKIHSEAVEDSLAVELEYPGFSGTLHVSWSIEGFPRPEHQLVIRTDRGILHLSGGAGAFVGRDGGIEVHHQLDAPGEFNLAPDFAGGGFVAELRELAQRATQAEVTGVGLDFSATVEFERTVFGIYRVAVAAAPMTVAPSPVELAPGEPPGGRLVLDLRDLAGADALAAAATRSWTDCELSSAQARARAGAWEATAKLRITVPDFLDHSRLLLSGRPLELVRRLGVGGTVAASLAAVGPVIRDRGASFWGAASALLAADLRGIGVPREFSGTLLLHPALVDLALALRRYDRLTEWLRACRAAAPAARIGLHTQLPREAAVAVAFLGETPDELSCVLSPQMPGREELGRSLHRATVRVVAEVGVAPAAVHRAAAREAARWMGDADGLLVHAAVVPELARALRADLGPRWATAFPGLDVPDLWA